MVGEHVQPDFMCTIDVELRRKDIGHAKVCLIHGNIVLPSHRKFVVLRVGGWGIFTGIIMSFCPFWRRYMIEMMGT